MTEQTMQLSEVGPETVVGKNGTVWYLVLRQMTEDEAGIDRANVGEDEVGLVVQFPDGGIENRVVPDQPVEVFRHDL